MNETVECVSSSGYADRPVALVWSGERLEVARIVGRWREPGGLRFRVLASDDRLFDLRYDEVQQAWRVEPL